jgi:hypothetical protein
MSLYDKWHTKQKNAPKLTHISTIYDKCGVPNILMTDKMADFGLK